MGGWQATLRLQWRHERGQTLADFEHRGPLRVLKALYPEGPAICHNVVVHPPGGVVGGDHLGIDGRLGAGCHALLTTPGATRFYRSDGAEAVQEVRMLAEPGSRLEWLPGETLVHDAARVSNRLRFELDEGAQMIGWEVLALGLPAAGEAFTRGHFAQCIELPGLWLEQGRIDAADTLLLDSPLGLAGRRTLATMWWAAGNEVHPAATEAALQAARMCIDAAGVDAAAVSMLQPRLIVLRALGDRVEPLARLLREVRAVWRRELWWLDAPPLRVWAT